MSRFARYLHSLKKIKKITDDPTLVNGVATIATWNKAEENLVARYMRENELGIPAYKVYLLPEVLASPYSLKIGSELVWQKPNWKCVVRAIDMETLEDNKAYVWVLALLLTRS